MELQFNWINLLILFGAIQGLIFGIILLFNKKHPGARFLSMMMFVLAYNGFETFNWSSGLDKYTFVLHLFPFVLIYAIGPSLYLYVKSLLYPDQKISRKKVVLHYGIVWFQFGFRSFEIIYHLLWVNNIYRGTWFSNQDVEMVYWTYSEPLSVIVFLGYLTATILQFRKAAQAGTVKTFPKESQRLVFKWIKALLISMLILGVSWPVTVVAPYFFNFSTDVYYYPIELGLVLFIYWIGFVGYHKTKIIYLKPPGNGITLVSDAEAPLIFRALQQIMTAERLYLDPELNLNQLSVKTGVAAKVISTVLNQHANTSFNDFVNAYRVEEVKNKLISCDLQHFTIAGIALEAGFNSQATFQRAFKNFTGRTPREYMNLQLKKTG